MAERRYTVAEIDRMRIAVEQLFPMDIAYDRAVRAKQAEERLRTYMLNGTEPEELEQHAKEARERRDQRMRAAGRLVDFKGLAGHAAGNILTSSWQAEPN